MDLVKKEKRWKQLKLMAVKYLNDDKNKCGVIYISAYLPEWDLMR